MVYCRTGGQYRAPGVAPITDGEPAFRADVGVYNGPYAADDTPFVTALGPAMTAISCYLNNSQMSGSGGSAVFNLGARETAAVGRGNKLFVTYSASAGGSGPLTPWAEIAAGTHDWRFAAFANMLATLPLGSTFSFANEPEVRAAGSQNPPGSGNLPTDFAAAWRRIHGIMAPIAPNIRWVWWISGTKLDTTMEQYYPGNAYVDAIGIDPYLWAHNSPTMTPTQKYTGPVNWCRTRWPSKPIGISETGADVLVHGDAVGVNWWNGVPAAVETLGLEWVTFFSRGEWRLNLGGTPNSWAAYVAAMQQIRGIA